MSKNKLDTRKRFRDDCFKRDKNCCVMCGAKESLTTKLDAHHVTSRKLLPKGGYVKENGITLCDTEQNSCHQKAESWWQDSALQSTGHEGFDPDTLYQKIGSSFAQALAACERL
jgi:5-methylcytosine-specific restriction endonuclease McrA